MNTIISVAGTLFILFGTGAWSLVETRSAHHADIQELRELAHRTLDAVCDNAVKKPRACFTSGEEPK